ncbi:MAG: hypothetical protein H6845_02220 [Alphaproteobacteria bacterium]|nr:MAG: hypothetical protein H6845_02220 [Alphaproteobacteria bacterium]
MKLVIIDGFSILFRNFFALKNFYNVDGLPVGGIVGFIKTITKLINKLEPTHMIIALDSGQKTWRHKLYPSYKSNRQSTPEDLIPQFDLLFELIECINITSVKGSECEADDWIASLTTQTIDICQTIYIISCDKDLMQLVTRKNVFMMDPFKLFLMQSEDIVNKVGVDPVQIPDLFGLVGDSSDCIPGVPTIGIKTAAKWVSDFGTLENILQNASKLLPSARRLQFIKYYDQALLSRNLVRLVHDLQIPSINNLIYSEHNNGLTKFINKYKLNNHFRSYI